MINNNNKNKNKFQSIFHCKLQPSLIGKNMPVVRFVQDYITLILHITQHLLCPVSVAKSAFSFTYLFLTDEHESVNIHIGCCM